MNDSEKTLDSHRSFMLMTEIAGEEPISQRELSRRMGIAVGLVNSYLKNLVAKGYVRIKAFPKNRYSYLLTPQGLTEKSRLAYQHLSYFTGLYTVARQDYLDLFRRLEADGVSKLAFCGVDEVAEIAYLSLQETGIELALVMDLAADGAVFFGNAVQPINVASNLPVVISSLKRCDSLEEVLLKAGVTRNRIFSLGNI
ncbi:MAG: winged helix-turn-helix transcriptional regulator [Geobacteraceae bacterium]|nr:winged helix-turn-helix transcriptional regulator [Geobacteraceae bacterium]